MDVEVDLGKIEAAEQSIDAFIEKRARDREAANAVEDLWRANDHTGWDRTVAQAERLSGGAAFDVA